MEKPFLSRPTLTYKESYIAAMREFHAEGSPPSWKYDKLIAHFDEFVAVRLAHETDPAPGLVPHSVYWLIVDGSFAGEIDFRHRLTPSLRRYGGHIGYRIRPTMRQNGYGTLQCKLLLDKIREKGLLDRVLITCDDDNIGSINIIEANGGMLEDKVDNGRHVLTRRYWIDLG